MPVSWSLVEYSSARSWPLLADSPLTLGRGAGCDVVVDSKAVSKEQCRILLKSDADHATGCCVIFSDVGETNFNYVDGRRIARGDSLRLKPMDTISLSSRTGPKFILMSSYASFPEAKVAEIPTPMKPARSVPLDMECRGRALQLFSYSLRKVWPLVAGKSLKFGRHASCDVVVALSAVSNEHCEIHVRTRRSSELVVELVCTGRTNGSYINGDKVSANGVHKLYVGDVLTLATATGPAFTIQEAKLKGCRVAAISDPSSLLDQEITTMCSQSPEATPPGHSRQPKEVAVDVDDSLECNHSANESIVDVVVCDSGLAGLREASALSQRSQGHDVNDAMPDGIDDLGRPVRTAKRRRLRKKTMELPAFSSLCFNSSKVECAICLQEQIVGSAVTLTCRHGFYCLECMTRFVETRLDDGLAGEVPCPECRVAIPETDLVKVLPKPTIFRLGVISAERQAICSGGILRACPTVDCPRREVLKEGACGAHTCIECGRESCWLCGAQPFHVGRTCRQHALRECTRGQQTDETSFQEWLEATGTRQCPKCQMAVSKENLQNQTNQRSECHKMLCRVCGTRFCFNCLAILTDEYTCGCSKNKHGFIDPHTGEYLGHLRKGAAKKYRLPLA